MGPNALFSFQSDLQNEMLFHIYKISTPNLLPLTGTDFGLAGQRAGALFFARRLDYFIVTQNSQPSPGLGTVKTIYSDPKLIATYRDWQKTMYRDADGT